MTGLFGAFALVFHLGQAPQGQLTLADALRIGETNAYGIRLADTQVERARQKAKEAIGALGPKLNLEGTYTRFDKAIISDFGGGPVVNRPIDSKEGRLVLTMPLDITGRTGRAVRSGANLGVRIAEENRKAARNDLQQTIKKAYFGALQAQASVAVAEETRARAEQRLKNARAELEAGTRARVDVLRLETALTQAESDLVAARGGLDLAKQALNNTLGRPVETPFDLAEEKLALPSDLDETQLAAEAQTNRPELASLRANRELQESIRKVEERGAAPSLNLSATHSRAFGQTGFGASTSSTVGVLSVSMPIWDSGINRARVRAARQDEEAARLQLEQAELGVSLEVRQALTSLRNAQARVAVAEQQLRLAEESYRLTVIKFEAGEGIPLEVADAAAQLTAAQVQLVNARYDALRALADLERAVGEDLKPGAPADGFARDGQDARDTHRLEADVTAEEGYAGHGQDARDTHRLEADVTAEERK